MKDIRYISEEDLIHFLLENKEKTFRFKQITEWLWKKGCTDFDQMSNLSQSLRDSLKKNFAWQKTRIVQTSESKDRTVKFLLQLYDGQHIEAVLIPSKERVTLCLSSQVGCALSCRFCATGTLGFTRNLHCVEILEQYYLLNQQSQSIFGHAISNLVYMGMGEPLLNYEQLIKSIKHLTSQQGAALSPSRITLSTVGITEKIKQLADENLKIGFAVSLHSADEKKRLQLMPVEKAHPLPILRRSLQYYHERTGDRITFEYLLLHQINDSLEDAEKLAQFCKAFPVKINIIHFHAYNDDFQASKKETTERFVQYLESKNMLVNVRQSKGEDIFAACGQLAKKY
jgi:23S rRNA (adenine2503-C2)-methyltransferase